MSDAKTAILITLDPDHEGGFQRDPRDRANWTGGQVGVGTLVGTNGGITTLDMPGVDIEHLTTDQKIAYYLDHYWKPLYSQIESQEVASKLFDMGVLFGINEAVYLLQRALNFTREEWTKIFDAETLAETNQTDPAALLTKYRVHLRAHALNISAANVNEAPALDGWLRRIDS